MWGTYPGFSRDRLSQGKVHKSASPTVGWPDLSSLPGLGHVVSGPAGEAKELSEPRSKLILFR
ncbi:hypothetical protein NOCARDAX2BIS_430020 [Nocardioides sp. AX2bis]|nr:hypothetical protein NOCARDAX2BIS_430020 [Nocardioides sp. AX2bis]